MMQVRRIKRRVTSTFSTALLRRYSLHLRPQIVQWLDQYANSKTLSRVVTAGKFGPPLHLLQKFPNWAITGWGIFFLGAIVAQIQLRGSSTEVGCQGGDSMKSRQPNSQSRTANRIPGIEC
jgi:hypothetical protein